MSSKRRYRTHAVILAAVLCLAGVFTLSYLAETGLVLEPANLTNATYTNETAPANETTEPLPDETFNETGETANGTAPEQPPEAPAPEPSTEEVLEPPTEPSFPETPAIPETQTSPSLAANYSVGTITINGTGNNCSTVNASINNASVFFWNGTTAWANAHIALDGNWTLDCGTLVMNESSDDQYVFDINSGGNLSFNTNQNIESNGYAFDIDLNSGGIIDWHADLDMSNTGAGDYVMTLDGSNLQIDCNSNKLISSSHGFEIKNHNETIQNCKIEANASSGDGIYYRTVHNLLFDNLHVTAGAGIHSYAGVPDLTIVKNTVFNTTSYGAVYWGATNLTADNITVHTGTGVSLERYLYENITVINSNFSGAATGVRTVYTGYPLVNWNISNNDFTGTTAPLALDGGGGAIENLTIKDNTITNCDYILYITDAYGFDLTGLDTDNTILNCTWGIVPHGFGNAIIHDMNLSAPLVTSIAIYSRGANNVTYENITAQNIGYGIASITYGAGANIVVRDSDFSGSSQGVSLGRGLTNLTLDNVTCLSCGRGFHTERVAPSSNVTITGCNFSGSNYGVSGYWTVLNDFNITNNDLSNAGTDAIYLYSDPTGTVAAIENNDLSNAGRYAIYLADIDNASIGPNTLDGSADGIVLLRSDNSVLQDMNANVQNSGFAAYVQDSSSVTIDNVTATGKAYGVRFHEAGSYTGNKIINSNFSSCTNPLYLEADSLADINITNNDLSNAGVDAIYIYDDSGAPSSGITIRDNDLSGSSSYGIHLRNLNITLSGTDNNSFNGCSHGLYLRSVNSSAFQDLDLDGIDSSGRGVTLCTGSLNTFDNITARNKGYGIKMECSGNMNNNTIINSDFSGTTNPVHFYSDYQCSYLNVSNNNLSHADTAIHLEDYDLAAKARYVTIYNNTLSHAGTYGIYLKDMFDSNISGNTLINNSIGLFIDDGTGNTAWNNTFNQSSSYFARADNLSNFNTSNAGNLWGDVLDLDIVDTDGDGYGDTGTEYPYNSTYTGKVTGYVNDWWPQTSNLNYPANTTQLFVNSSSGYNFDTDNLSCWAKGEDDLNQNITVYWKWYNDSLEALSGSLNISNNTLSHITTLTSGNTSGEETWTCSVRMFDGVSNESEWNNASVTLVATKFYWLKTYTLDARARSFFGVNETVRIRAKTRYSPIITISDPQGNPAVTTSMTNETPIVNNIAVWYYDFIPNQTGWYSVSSVSTNYGNIFYSGPIWQTNWTDSNGTTFPFRIQVNLSEPGVMERFFEPIDLHLNFTYKMRENSVRVTYWNGSHLIELPSQVYNLTYQDGYGIAGNAIFLTSLNKSENTTHYVYYSRADPGARDYGTDLNVTNTSDFYEVQNTEYRVELNRTKGGLVQAAYHKRGLVQNLTGFDPMQLSPEIRAGPYIYRASDLSTPSIELANNSLVIVYKTSGDVGTVRFNLTYTFYSHAPYFILEANITAKGPDTWQYYKDHIFYISDASLPTLAFMNATGIFSQALADISNLLTMEWLGLYNNETRSSFGSIFLDRQQTQSYTPDIDVFEEAGYDYYERTQYAGAVAANDCFYSRTAMMLWNALDDYEKINESYYKLSSPINASWGVPETYDTENPLYTVANYTPQLPDDADNVTCYSYWTDNLEMEQAVITINSSGYINQTSQYIGTNESWVNYTITADRLEAGPASCNITVYDIAGLENSTQISFNVSDSTPPYVTLPPEPDNATLDPDANITITANVTEYTNMSTAILQYRHLSPQAWQNTTMDQIATDAYNYTYSANFTPDTEDVWQYRIYANDTLGYANYTPTTNLSIFYDWTWQRGPVDFGAVSGLLNENMTLGSLVIDNNGDKALGFKITSNWDDKNQIYFDGTPESDAGYTFSLSPDSLVIMQVKVTAKSTERFDSLTITIDALNASADPDFNTTNATVVSFASGPFLLTTVTDYNISVIQGDTGIILKAKAQNKGNETATSTWLAFDLPPGWTLTSGELNSSIGILGLDQIAYNEVTVSIDGDAPTGLQTLTALSGCAENKTGSDSVQVLVVEKPAPEVIEEAAPRAGAGGPPVGLTQEQKEKLFQTTETYELVRGREQNFTLRVENPFDGALQDVMVNVSGFLSQYLRVTPPRVARIGINRSANFTIHIEAPEYFTKGEYKLNFTITGTINKTRLEGNITIVSITYIKEGRLVTMIIHEVSREEASEYLNSSMGFVEEMSRTGLNTERVSLLLSQAMQAFENREYEEVKSIYETILENRELAFGTLALLDDVGQQIGEAAYNGINIPRTERLALLSRAALERGDYVTALSRAEDARLTYALETVGQFNLLAFIINNWPRLSLGGALIAALAYLGLLSVRFNLTNRRLKSLKKEEGILLGLIKEAQKECFEKKKLSMKEYLTSLVQYEKKISKVVQRIIELETVKASLFKPFRREPRRLLGEKEKLLTLIRKTQRLYLQIGKIETRVYESRMRSYTERLVEIDERLATLEARKAIRRRLIK